jgi:hypothetical protein
MHFIYCIENVTALSYHVNVAIKLSIYIVAIYCICKYMPELCNSCCNLIIFISKAVLLVSSHIELN